MKPMQTRIYLKKYVNGFVNLEGHLKILFLNQARRLFTSISVHLCYQKPNPSREAVPLNVPAILISGCWRDAKEFLLGRESI
jgi:hypothetical protein